MATSKEKRKYTRVRPRGVVAHVRGPSAAFACQVENLSAGGLFLRTEQQLPHGTALHIDLVKPGGRKSLHLSGLVAAGSALCDDSKRAEVESFFRERMAGLPGGPRRYAQAVEQLRNCAAFRAAQAPAVVRFFSAARASR